MSDPREPRFDAIAVALAELRVRLEHLIAESRQARRRSLELRAAAAGTRKATSATRARLRGEEYELVDATDDGLWVVADATGRLHSFDGVWPLDRPEVRCDFCGRWSLHAAPVRSGLWASWQCFGGTCAEPREPERAGAGRKGGGPTGT